MHQDDFEFVKDNGDGATEWHKDNARARDFDFDAFLGDDLDDRVTQAVDGRDVLEPDAFGGSVPEYIPGRSEENGRGRHEAARTDETEPAAGKTPAEEPAAAPAMDPNDPRYAAPERPRVVVAQPRPKVYVTPDSVEEDEEQVPARSHEGLKWVIAVLAVIAIFAAALLFLLQRGEDDGQARPTPVPTSESSQAKENTPAPATEKPAETDAPTAPPAAKTYTITVTAGSGGRVSPNGAVIAQEGEDASFLILPDSGFELSELLIDGTSVSLTDSYVFTDVTENHTLYAVFREAATPTPEPTAEPTLEPTPTPEPTAEPTPEPTEPPEAGPEETTPEEVPEE